MQRIQEVDDAHVEEEEAKETHKILARSLLRGLPTNEAIVLDPTRINTMPSTLVTTPKS